MTPTCPVVDVALWFGQYPFRGIPDSSVESLEARLAALNVERGVVAPLEGIFWENNLDAYDRLADEISGGETLDVWPVLRPGALHGVGKLLDRYKPRGLRLLPSYHDYRLSDPAAAEIFAIARERGMVVQVFQRIADERWHYMLKVPGVDPTDLEYLTAVCPDQPVILSGLSSIPAFSARLRQLPGLYADLSRVRGPQFAVEQLCRSCPVEKLLFGSLWPIQIIEATLWQVTAAKIGEGERAAILHGNARKLLAR
jgi:predicted TIM-barrel fold metal-dependent hydrolase